MVWASATTPYYFRPATIKGEDANDKTNLYLSGDNIALSPALYAYLHANEKLGKDLKHLRVVSVGAINEEADKIDTKTSLIEWVGRLTSLMNPVKKHTMDYLV